MKVLSKFVIVGMLVSSISIGYGYVSNGFSGYTGQPTNKNTTQYYDNVFKTKNLGEYSIKIDAYEIPSNEWLMPIKDQLDFKDSTTVLTTEVDNRAPSATYSLREIPKVDVVLAVGELNDLAGFNSYSGTFKNKVAADSNYFDTKFTTVETYSNRFVDSNVTSSYIESYWDEYPLNSNYKIYYDYICNLFNQDGHYRFEHEGTGSHNQVYIAEGSYNTSDYTFNVSMKIHGCDVGSGVIVRWDTANDVGYILLSEYKKARMALYYVPRLSSYIGGEAIVDGTNPNWKLLKSWDYSPKTAFPNNMEIESGNYSNIQVELKGRSLSITADDSRFNYTFNSDGYISSGAFGLWAGCSVAYKDIDVGYDKITERTLGEVLKEVNWRDNSIKFIVNMTNGTPLEFSQSNLYKDEDYATTIMRLIDTGGYIVNLGDTSNRVYLDKLMQEIQQANGTAKGTFCDISNGINTGLDSASNYIVNKVNELNTNISMGDIEEWLLAGTDIMWYTHYSDVEKDPPLNLGEHTGKEGSVEPHDTVDLDIAKSYGINSIVQFKDAKINAEMWRFRHINDYFDNSPDRIAKHDMWIENPLEKFDNTGKYRINYKRKDNALYPDVSLTNVFNEYRYWSSDYDPIQR